MLTPSPFLRFLEKIALAAIQAIRESSLSIKRGEIQAKGFAVILISVLLVLKGDLLIDTIQSGKLSIPESAKSEIWKDSEKVVDLSTRGKALAMIFLRRHRDS